MEVHILTLFPGMFTAPLQASILQRAQERCLLPVHLHNLRDFTTDRHHVTDDAPYDGGGGINIMPEPIVKAYQDIHKRPGLAKLTDVCPTGFELDEDHHKSLRH